MSHPTVVSRSTGALILLPLVLTLAGTVRADADGGALSEADSAIAAQPIEYQIVRRDVPTLKRFKLVDLNTQQLSGRVDQGLPVRLPFVSQENPGQAVSLQFDLSPHPITERTTGLVLRDFGQGEVQAEQWPLPPRREFVGPAHGATNSLAGFSIRPDRVQGAALIPLAEAGYSGWSFIEPIAPLLRRNGASQADIDRVLRRYDHVAYSSAGIESDAVIDDDEQGSTQPPDPDAIHARSGIDTVVETVSIYLQGDVDFVNDHGGDVTAAFDSQELLMLWVELITDFLEPGVYGNGEFAVDLDIAGQAVWVLGGPTATASSVLLEESYNLFPWSIEATPVNDIGLIHMYTGKNLDGNIIGQAWKIGGFDDACGTSYSTGAACKQSVAEWQWSGSTYYEQIIVMAHELGHNLDGEHGDYDPSYCAGSLCGPTIMKSGVSSSQVPYYSATNAAAIAAKVSSECAGDPC